MLSVTPGRDMRGIRQTPKETYVVRVCVNGVQRHVGTFRTYEDALRARDNPKPKGSRPERQPGPSIEKKPKANGVYERFNAHGRVYDVFKYKDGHLCWGGRYQTRIAAEEAAAQLKYQTDSATPKPDSNEPGITMRYNRGRKALGAAPTPVYVARSYKGGGKYLGTWSTIEEARAAVSAQAASVAVAAE